MLSLSNISSRQASSYYKQDGYYARLDDMDNSWQGNLKEPLYLPDKINRRDFDALVNERKERAGFDLCFSAPKSVSVAMCLDESIRRDMIKAHEAAVTSVLAKIEEREIGARVTKDKLTEHIKTGKMICGKFNHYVSRASDPQLHTHCVILNKTFYGGKYYAIDNPALYSNKILYGQLYRNELAAELLRRGYDLALTDAKKGFFELKGLDKETLAQFSTRRREIAEKLKEWGARSPEASEKAAIMTRHAKEHRDLNLLTQSWKETLQDMGGADLVKESSPILRTDEQKRQEFLQAVHHLARKDFAFTEKDLKRAILAAGVASGLSESEQEGLVKSASGKDLMGIGSRVDKPSGPEYYTTLHNLETEQAIFSGIEKGRNAGRSFEPGKVRELIRARELAEAQQAAKEGREPKSLSKQQKQAVLGMTSTGDQYYAIQGLAGTGKTFALQYVKEIYESAGYTVIGASTAGRAAHGLEADSGIKSSTLHSLLNKLEKEAGNMDPAQDLQEKETWNLTGLQPGTGAKEVWVIDEAGMMDNNLMKTLTEAAEIKGAKVILVGDDRQLPPIGVGNAFGALIQTDRVSYSQIDEIRRQRDENTKAAVIEAVKGDVNKSLELLAEHTKEIASSAKRIKEIVQDYTALTPKEQEGCLILTADNKSRRMLNDSIRAELQKAGTLQNGGVFSLQDKSGRTVQRDLAVGDKVIFLQNDRKLGVDNGQLGQVEKINGAKLTVRSENKSLIIDTAQYKKLDHGYALTVHKSQGATVDRVLVNLDSSQAQLLNRNAFYVDISRVRYEAKLYTDDTEKVRAKIQDFARKLTSEDFLTTKKTPEMKKTLSQHIQDAAKEMLQSLKHIRLPRIKPSSAKGPVGPNL